VNPALIALPGTVTLLGTVTAELLLDRLTLTPPPGAEPVSVTVHVSVPDPVMAPLLQDSVFTVGAPVLSEPRFFPCSKTISLHAEKANTSTTVL